MSYFAKLSAAALAAGLAAVQPAAATSLTASELLDQFGLITRGDVTSTSEVEGRILIGGDLSGNMNTNFNLGSGGGVPASVFDEAIVAGTLMSGATLRVQNGGDASVGTVAGGTTVDLQGGGTLSTGSVSVPEDYAAVLDAYSAMWAATAATATAVMNGQTLTFSATAEPVTVFEVTWSQLYSNNGYNISGIDYDLGANPDALIVINVSGTSGSFTNNNELAALGSQVIWNFYEAEDFTINARWVGAVLAPGAQVTTTTALEGTLYADSARLYGEVHRQGFTGYEPAPEPAPEPPPVPLPAGLPLLAGGLAALAALRRRRRA